MRFIFFFVALWGAVSCSPKLNDGFVLKGTIPGVPDSSRVTLFFTSSASMKRVSSAQMETRVVNGKFEFRGKVDRPTCCALRVDEEKDSPERRNWTIDFFVENGNLTFDVSHVDSLPSAFSEYDERKEVNYKLTGSKSQKIYEEYQRSTCQLRFVIARLMKKCELSQDAEDYTLLHQKKEELKRWIHEFIPKFRNLEVSLHLAKGLLKDPFTYNEDYLQELNRLFTSYQDTCVGLRIFRQYIQDASVFVQGKRLEDAVLYTSVGEKCCLLDLLNKEGYTFIDFWASWCGSCRAGFPALKELHKCYGKRVKFVSIAISDKENAWQQAMKEEALPWDQFLGHPNLAMELKKLYAITSIPKFLLIDREGKIVYCGSRSGDMESELKHLLN